MTSPKNDRVEPPVDEAGTFTRFLGNRRRTVAIATALGVLLISGATVIGLVVGRSSAATPAAASAAITTPPSRSSSSTVASTPGTNSAAVLPSAQPGKKIAPPAMSREQSDKTRAELNALAARLPTHMTLTAPATWAQYAGQTPTYTEDIISCPHIADRLAADLGARWTYSYGKLPTGPAGCFWTPVPWVPDVSRFFVSIGYQVGRVPDLMKGMDYCAGGVEAPRLDVPAVGRGAVLYGCDDANGAVYDLAVPDAGGSGVFFLHATGGTQQSPAQVAEAMLAVIDGTTHAYG